MRIPRPAHGHRWDYWYKRLWELYVRNRKIYDYSNPPDMPPGTQIIDAVEFVKPKSETVKFPAPYRKEAKYLDNEDNPNWKTQILHYSRDTLIFDGHKQLLSLFKTVPYEGLASSVEALVGKLELQNADYLLTRRILHDYVWDSTQIRLPQRMHPENHRWRLPRDYGIPLERKVYGRYLFHGRMATTSRNGEFTLEHPNEISFVFQHTNAGAWEEHESALSILLGLEKQLINLCAMAVGPPSCQLYKMTSPYAKVFFIKDDKRILSEFVGDSLLLGKTALKPFDPSPSSTEEQEVADIYPLAPTLDLTPLNIYQEGNQFCLNESSPKRFCHTLLISHNLDNNWALKQKLARGIAGCFTFAASQATRLFGPSVGDLPEPVALNCILVDENSVALLSYQLNTLNLSGKEGVKNQVWIEGPHQLFESYDQDNGLVGYNPTVFPRVLALYLNGLTL